MHSAAIYVRTGPSWTKALSMDASGPIKALALLVFPGDWGCPDINHRSYQSYRDTCGAIVKWDGKAFVYTLLWK